MNPRAVAVWALAATLLSLLSSNPIDRALLLLVSVNVALAICRPGRSARPAVILGAATFAGAVIINTLEAHAGAHVLLTLPAAVPLAGGPITAEAVAWGGATGLGIAAAIFAVAPLALALDPQQVITALPSFMDRSATVLATSLMLIPALGRTAQSVRETQTLRGWRSGRLRSWGEVVTPVITGAMEGALTLAESLEARGFGSTARRTRWNPIAFGRADRAVVAAAAAAIVVDGAARVRGWSHDWYPFPTLVVPSASPAVLIVAALMLTPVLAWRRQYSIG